MDSWFRGQPAWGKLCFSEAVGGGFVCLCACYYGSVVFFLLLWGLISQPDQCSLPALRPWIGSTSSHSPRGADLTSVCRQIRQSIFGQQRRRTIQMLIFNCRHVPWCFLLRFDWILLREQTWLNQIPTAYLWEPCWWLKKGMVITVTPWSGGFSNVPTSFSANLDVVAPWQLLMALLCSFLPCLLWFSLNRVLDLCLSHFRLIRDYFEGHLNQQTTSLWSS